MSVNIPMKTMIGSTINAVQNNDGTVTVTKIGSKFGSQPVLQTLTQDEFIKQYDKLIDDQKNISYSDTFSKSGAKQDFDENIVTQYKRDGLLRGQNLYKGSINDKVVSLHEDTKSNFTNTFRKSEVCLNGTFGGKETFVRMHDKDFISGHVDGKGFSMSIEKNLLGNRFEITGKIGDKDINIRNGSSIKDAQSENDILTLCASLKSYSFDIKDGNFNKLIMSKQAKNNENAAMADFAFAQSMGMV